MKQLITYFLSAYIISWIIWFPLYAPAMGLGEYSLLPYHHGLGGLGPMLAGFLTTLIYSGRKGVIDLLRSCIKIRPFVLFLIALLSPFILTVFAAVIDFFTTGIIPRMDGMLTTAEFPEFNLITFFLYNLFFFGFGEEVGWRGFALPRIQKNTSALLASFLLTIFWALWHWPLFFYRPGYDAMGWAGIIGWFFSLFTGSILMTWLFNSSRGSILICAIIHSTIDIAFTSDLADKNIMNYLGFLVTLWGILIIILFKPKNLSRSSKVTGEL